MSWSEGTLVRVGIGELAVSGNADDVLSTVALGSCVAVCLWEPMARIAGLLHFMLPDSSLNLSRAQLEPAVFADTGISMLFRAAYSLGAQKKWCKVRLVGGADIAGRGNDAADGIFNVGRRNVLAARGVLWRNGILIEREAVGGTTPRTLTLNVLDGQITVKTDGHVVTQL